jgi:hypothetical protein
MSLFLGLTIELDNGITGIIESSFGKGGKFKINLNTPLSEEVMKEKTFKSK